MKKTNYSLLFGAFVLAATFSPSCIFSQFNNVQVDHVNQTFDNISSVDVKGSFCTVIVNSGNSDQVSLVGTLYSNTNRDDIKIRYTTEGTTLKISIEKPSSFSGSLKGNLDLVMPVNTNLNVENSSGSVSVSNLGNANFRIQTSSGSIKIANIKSDVTCHSSSGSQTISDISGSLSTETSSGSQQINSVGGNVSTSASSGGIKIMNVKGEVRARTSSGSLWITIANRKVDASATSGSVHIEKINGDVKAATSSGSIHLDQVKGMVDLQSTSGSQNGSSIMLTGNSSFQSSSGSIHMDLLNSASEISFHLTASSGSLKAFDVNGNHSLHIQQGPVTVKGNSSSGSQAYY